MIPEDAHQQLAEQAEEALLSSQWGVSYLLGEDKGDCE